MAVYQRCTRCVMDNKSDDTIVFDSNGVCNYCTDALAKKDKNYFPNELGEQKLNELISRLKSENADKEFDCIMGISGGLDSSYLAYLGAAKWGLRILAIHVDDGYDTEISKRNIKRLCDKAKIKLITISPDEKQFNELIRAYIMSEVPNLAVPQDNVLFACIYKYMREHGIRTFLSGGNYALESILQKGNTHEAYDLRNLKDINSKFGRDKIDKLPTLSNFQRDWDILVRKIESPRPLNYINYNREQALKDLFDYCGFEYYGSKHLENSLTKLIQIYWLYNKFNVDKRTSHLSSMIVSDQMTREEAMNLLDVPLYDAIEMNKEVDAILSKLDISRDEFDALIRRPPKQHSDYRTSLYAKLRKHIKKMLRM